MLELNFRITIFALLGIATICALCFNISAIIYSHKIKCATKNIDRKRTTFRVCSISILVIFTIAIILVFILIGSYIIATTHGLYTSDLTLNQLYTGIANTPIEDNLPDDIAGSIIILYKFGCTDCDAIYKNLSEYISDKQDVYWISSRSEQGKMLLELYPVESVPTGIYIHTDSDENSYTKKSLHYTDTDGETQFDVTAIERLLYLQAQNR